MSDPSPAPHPSTPKPVGLRYHLYLTSASSFVLRGQKMVPLLSDGWGGVVVGSWWFSLSI